MIRRLPALLCLLGILAGCEDPDVKNVQRREFLHDKDLLTLQQESGAVMLEIHGVPWAGAEPEEIAGTLRMPEGRARDVRFHPVPPAQGNFGSGERIVMWFNPKRGAGDAMCTASAELPTEPPSGKGFTVRAAFCRGTDWVVRLTFEADDISANDWLAYFLRMQDMMDTMFPR